MDTTNRTAILAIRPGTPDDAGAISRLAALDSAAVPAGETLLGIVDGRPLAVLSLTSGEVVADPFAPTAELVGMLRHRAARLAAGERRRVPRRGLVAGRRRRRPSPA
jgi:hypothetical protein